MAEVVSFPVVFFDGENEIDIGNVTVEPHLGFKKFQTMISQKIGISPHQISLSFIGRKKSMSATESRRKIPIHENFNFAALIRQKEGFFFAVLKRSRRDRRGKPRRVREDENFLYPDHPWKRMPPPDTRILRRDSPIDTPELGNFSPFNGQFPVADSYALGFLENLQRHKEMYLTSTKPNGYTQTEGNEFVLHPMNDRFSKARTVCAVCSASNGRPVPFHWCIYDAVTVGFRSPAGPIKRPAKVSGDEAARKENRRKKM